MSEMLARVVFYDWLLLALIILVIEILTGTMYLLWIGIGAFVTGALMFFAPYMPWQMQFIVFGVVSIASMALWLKFGRTIKMDEANQTLNQRGSQFVGKSYPLKEAIVNGRGVLNIDDTRWTAKGEDAEAGAIVTVVSVDGNTLHVTS